jgi:hypothetical protein
LLLLELAGVLAVLLPAFQIVLDAFVFLSYFVLVVLLAQLALAHKPFLFALFLAQLV